MKEKKHISLDRKNIELNRKYGSAVVKINRHKKRSRTVYMEGNIPTSEERICRL